MKYKVKKTHGLSQKVTGNDVPQSLSPTVDVTIWNKEGDHPKVEKIAGVVEWNDPNNIVSVRVNDKGESVIDLYKDEPPVPASTFSPALPVGSKCFQKQRVTHFVNDEHGSHHIVLPGYAIVTNDSDGVTWAISPDHLAAWFEPA